VKQPYAVVRGLALATIESPERLHHVDLSDDPELQSLAEKAHAAAAEVRARINIMAQAHNDNPIPFMAEIPRADCPYCVHVNESECRPAECPSCGRSEHMKDVPATVCADSWHVTSRQPTEAELTQTTNAVVWAKRFRKTFGPNAIPNEEALVGWFANAIEAGRNAAASPVTTGG
jgi:hypothetical protein